jgi:hypothetical protein
MRILDIVHYYETRGLNTRRSRRSHGAPRKTLIYNGATHPALEEKNASTTVSAEQFLKHLMMTSDSRNM